MYTTGQSVSDRASSQLEYAALVGRWNVVEYKVYVYASLMFPINQRYASSAMSVLS